MLAILIELMIYYFITGILAGCHIRPFKVSNTKQKGKCDEAVTGKKVCLMLETLSALVRTLY